MNVLWTAFMRVHVRCILIRTNASTVAPENQYARLKLSSMKMICLRNGHGIRMQQRASLLKLVTLEVLQLLVRLAKIQNRLLRCLRKISELVCEPADCA